MKKILGVLLIIVLAAAILTGVLFVYYHSLDKKYEDQIKENQVVAQNETKESDDLKTNDNADNPVSGSRINIDNEEKYFVIYENNRLCIYKGENKSFFDFADINPESLSQELKNKLENGIWLTGQGELYGFLQEYSS